MGPGRRICPEAHRKKRDHEDEEAQVQITSNQIFLPSVSGAIELSPGMSQEIDVIFRPIKEEIYEDTIYFKLEELPWVR